MAWLKFDYFLFVFVTSCGLLQAVFSFNRLAGLQFFKKRSSAYVFAGACSLGAFVWFFTRPNYDLPPHILEGKQQTLTFMASSVAAVAFSLFVSSLINRGRDPASPTPPAAQGLDELKHITYVRALPLIGRDLVGLFHSLRRWARR